MNIKPDAKPVSARYRKTWTCCSCYAIRIMRRAEKKELGRGSFEIICQLITSEKEKHIEAIQVIDVGKIKDDATLRELNKQLEVLIPVVIGSDMFKHQNVISFLEVFFSRTRRFGLMEYRGYSNLSKRFVSRDREGYQRRLLRHSAATFLVEQMFLSVAHIHLLLLVCHRDIKFENMIVQEHDGEGMGEIALRVANFDLPANSTITRAAQCLL